MITGESGHNYSKLLVRRVLTGQTCNDIFFPPEFTQTRQSDPTHESIMVAHSWCAQHTPGTALCYQRNITLVPGIES